ncbi:MAG: type II secretion system protein [Verrucomicrobiales bacterium]
MNTCHPHVPAELDLPTADRSVGIGIASRRSQAGFSLVEMLVVIAIIGILASIAVPNIGTIREKARISATVADFRNFRTAFYTYSLMQNGYPPDSHNALPAGVGMEVYLPASSFEREAPISGRYNWEGPDNYSYAGISLTTTNATISELAGIDDILDDGNLATGYFRRTANGRYTYIIEDGI